MSIRILTGHVLDRLSELPDESVNCVVTSPPYFQLRSYGTEPVEWPDGWIGELGQEPTLDLFIEHLVLVFRECRRVLRPDGTCWVNVGDSSQSKQLLMVPARIALALQADGWWLRSDIIWHKPNPMPESVRDRPTNAHEHIFLLTKSARYWYDADAVREAMAPESAARYAYGFGGAKNEQLKATDNRTAVVGNRDAPNGANLRNVWSVATVGFAGAHFAVFPPEIPRRCIKAGCPPGGVVLDPFFGSGTTGLVADELGRDCIGIELNPKYAALAEGRIRDAAPMFAEVKIA